MKIVVIGCSKRFTNVYYEIISSLGHDIFLWNRSVEKSENFCKVNKTNHVKDLEELKSIKPDLILVFVPAHSQYEVIKLIPETNSKILVETPAEDHRIISLQRNVGVLEQWPFLPLEQFKRKIYEASLIKRPYMVFNDGRSFDYHAIAQLRDYLGRPLPVSAKGSVKSYDNQGVVDNSGKLNTLPHEWTIGQLEMSDGSILSYSFSYNCKSLLAIPIQFLRSISVNGSIITGRMKEIGNDYEFIDVRYVNPDTKNVHICEVEVERRENTTFSISIPEKLISWVNPYSQLGFDDQQTAMASLIDDALSGKIYSFRDAYIDYICINMIKRSGCSQQVVHLTQT